MSRKLIQILTCPYCSREESKVFSLQKKTPEKNNNAEKLYCENCDRNFPVKDKIIDLIGEGYKAKNLLQQGMEFQPIVKVYERFGRPVFTSIISSLSWEKKQIEELMELETGNDVLDIACGPGYHTRPFSQKIGGDGLAVGLDISMPMLIQARHETRKIPLKNLEFLRADVTKWPFQEKSFDRIHCSGALHLFPGLLQVLNSISKTLKPGGNFVCSTYLKGRNPVKRRVKKLTEPFSGFHWFDPEELQEMTYQTGFTKWQQKIKKDGIVFRVDYKA